MSAVVRINGRLWWSTVYPAKRLRLAPSPPTDMELEDAAQPRLCDPLPLHPSGAWAPGDGVTYRVLQRFRANEGWASAETVMRWYDLRDFGQLARMVERGVVDAAVQVGSVAKRFRVLDHARCTKMAEELLAGKRAPVKRPRRVRR